MARWIQPVIDGKWDEKGQFMVGSELSLSYQPKMCEKTVWQVWEENSGRVYIRAPTDEEIIKTLLLIHLQHRCQGREEDPARHCVLPGMQCLPGDLPVRAHRERERDAAITR